MRTIEIDLGDGDSAELYAELRHGTAREVERIYRPYFAKPEYQAVLKLEAYEEKLKALAPLMIESEDASRATDAIILGQVKSWTFGEITQQVLDDMPERKHQQLAKEANRLYEDPLPASDTRS